MTVDELIELLEEYRGMEVRLGVQPGYPYQCGVAGVTEDTEESDICYILQGAHIDYLSKKVWKEI